MIAVCMPSRGLIHSRTIEHVLKNIKESTYKFYFSHDKAIPECFNDITERALQDGAQWLWFVEEDMQFPSDTLAKMLASGKRVCTIDYPVSPDFNVVLYENGELMRFGTGCTLIKADVFAEIGKTWRSDVAFVLPDWEVVQSKHETYGQHDIEFAQRCRKAGIEVEVVGVGNQYRVIEQGQSHTNTGWHEIRTIT